jgi:NADH dehydrogenase
MSKTNSKTRVLVVGGGFGGVKAALELSRHDYFAITLLSDRPNFHYYPALYHTATGGTVDQSRIHLGEIFKGKDVTIAQGSAQKLNRAKKQIITTDGSTYEYDVLVMALGVMTNYFGIEGMAEHSYSIKAPEDALKFKDHLHEQLTRDHRPDHNYVIVGGGPTGIELAGAMSRYVREIMRAHNIKGQAPHIDLVEAAPTLVPRMPAAMGKRITKRLQSLGVKVFVNKVVQGASADDITIGGKPLQSHTIVWTAGVTNHPFFKENGFQLNERGSKVTVNEYLEAEDNIYVLGDNADTQYSGVAQTALVDAHFVAHNLTRKAQGELMERYKPKRPIYVIPVGPRWAAVQWGNRQLYGWVGWVLRNAADWIGFKDLEPWWKASMQWMTEFESEEDCNACIQHRAKA